jgi:hypothetical protein
VGDGRWERNGFVGVLNFHPNPSKQSCQSTSNKDSIENTTKSLQGVSKGNNVRYNLKTTTKNPIWRLLFVALAFLLVNIWVNLLWHYISKDRRGGRLIYQKLFGLKQMLAFLTQGIHHFYPPRKEILLPVDG